jgi:hypothetical protein
LFTEGEMDKIKSEATMVGELMNIIPLLGKINGIETLKEDCYPLALYMVENPVQLTKCLDVISELITKDENKAAVLMDPTDCMKAMLGLKNKYAKNEEMINTIDKVLDKFDSTYMIEQTIAELKAVKNEDLELQKKE